MASTGKTGPARGGGARAAREPAAASVTARLFDADRTDSTLELRAALRRRLGDRQLLWVDVEGALDPGVADAISRRMGLAPRTRRALVQAAERPQVSLHGSYFHLRLATAADGAASTSPRWLDLIASEDIVVSCHAEPIEPLVHLDDRIEADTTVGAIDGAAFVRSVLDATVTGYFQAVDRIEDAVDEIDGRALAPRPGDELLERLVALRRRVARLRRTLSDQREVFATLGAAEFKAVDSDDDAADFRVIADRFQSALQSVEDSRDLLIGSFDVFMTRTAQRTNETMKALTLVTVLLLPGSLIAALFGMNVEVPLPKDGMESFWLVVLAIALIAVGVLVVARLRRWI